MPYYEPKQLFSKTRKGDLEHVYYLYGADHVQVEQLTTLITRKATAGNIEMGLTKFDGQNLELKTLAEAAQQFSMFSPCNCIQVHDFQVETLTDGQFQFLTSIIKSIADATILIFDITGFDPKKGKKLAQGKTKKFIDCIAKHGAVCEAVQRTTLVLAKEMIALAERQNRKMTIDGAEELVQLCMGNTLILRSEVEKLCAYVENGGTITKELIHDMTTPQLESTTFQLAKAVVSQRPKAALEELDKLFAMRIQRTAILHAIASAFVDLYCASVALHHGKQALDVKGDFHYSYDFVVQNAFRDCRKISTSHLRICIKILRDLEENMNSGSCNERIMLETAITKMLAIAGGYYDTYRPGDYRRGKV